MSTRNSNIFVGALVVAFAVAVGISIIVGIYVALDSAVKYYSTVKPAQATYEIEIYTGGQHVRKWKSNGFPVLLDRYTYFVDADTGQEVYIKGNVVVTRTTTNEPPSK